MCAALVMKQSSWPAGRVVNSSCGPDAEPRVSVEVAGGEEGRGEEKKSAAATA